MKKRLIAAAIPPAIFGIMALGGAAFGLAGALALPLAVGLGLMWYLLSAVIYFELTDRE